MLSAMQRCAIFVLIISTLAVGFFQGSLRQNNRKVSSVLQSTPTGKTPLVAKGKRFEADPGSSLIVACTKLGLKVPTKCKKGECGTCSTTVAGVKIRACIGKVPPAPRLKSLIEKGLAVTVDNAR